MSKKKVIIIVCALLVLAASAYGVITYISGSKAGASGRPVTELIVGRDTIITKVTSKGEVALLNTELIYANLVAEVDEVLAEKNDIVSAGQPIIRYREKSREDLVRSIERARLDVQSAELALNSAKLPPSASSIERARLDVENAQKAVERAADKANDTRKDIERQENNITEAKKEIENSKVLLSVGAISKKALEDAEKSLKAMEDDLEALKKSLIYSEQEIGTAEENHRYSTVVYKDITNKSSDQSTVIGIKQQEISLQKAKLALSELEKELESFEQEIFSPINGTVIAVNVSRGEITPTNKALMEIADVSNYVIKVDINERNAAKIIAGQDVNLSGAVLGDAVLTGKVTKIGNIAETKQNSSNTERVIPVEITVDKGSNSEILKPGFSLDATIITSVKENIVAIPILSTLTENDGSSYVFIIKDDNTLEKRTVKLGAYADMMVEAEGVSEGERIVSQPAVDMTDGMAVSIIGGDAE